MEGEFLLVRVAEMVDEVFVMDWMSYPGITEGSK
jgi:hypothetical protein